MPKKRKSAEINDDQLQEMGGSESKREKLDLPSNTTLQDLPLELIECILVRVVAMEVKDWKLAKNIWEDRADLVKSRLGSVCSQWESIVTTNFFRNELRRTLDGYGQKPIRLEIIRETRFKSTVVAMTTLKDDLFLLSAAAPGQRIGDYSIEVYNRSNMSIVRDVIPIPRVHSVSMRACSVSNCVYVLMQVMNCDGCSVASIAKNANDQYTVSPWQYDRRFPVCAYILADDGDVLLGSVDWDWGQNRGPAASIYLYSHDGSLQHDVTVLTNGKYFDDRHMLQKSNGNLVVAALRISNLKTRLIEIDLQRGAITRIYRTSAEFSDCCVNFADPYGRIVISDPRNGIELLDSQFNLLGVYSWRRAGSSLHHCNMHYERAENEIVCVYRKGRSTKPVVLARLRFTDE